MPPLTTRPTPLTQPRLYSVQEFERLVESGQFGEAWVELIEGELCPMSPQGPRHAWCIAMVSTLLMRLYSDRHWVRVQLPITLDHSEPIPDVAIARLDNPLNAHPKAQDLLLVIEIADHSLSYDLGQKMPLYARNGILEFWLIDILGQCVRVYRDPGPTGYGSLVIYQRGETIVPLAAELRDRPVEVDRLLPNTP